MSKNTEIKTTKIVYPQIYAYVIPNYEPNEGWIKIGETKHYNVEDRIKQQTQTAGIISDTLWSGPARFGDDGDWFTDKQFHLYLRKHKEIKQREGSEWFYYDGFPEESKEHFNEFRKGVFDQVKSEQEYRLRKEQEAAVRMTLNYAKNNKGGEFLWNAKPRFGKTLSTYDFARRLEAKKVLIVTNRPAIANSWFDDFETFIAWQTNYRFVSTTDSLKDRPVLTREEFLREAGGKSGEDFPGCIAFISLQDLKGSLYFGGYINKLKWVKDLEWDLLVIDEAHEGVDTFKTDVAFNEIKRAFTLHLSGTPFKALAKGNFTQEQIYNWSYADEQEAKATWPLDSEENNPYEDLPRLNMFSYQISQMITDEVNKGANIDGEDMDFAFDLNEFFATKENGAFEHEAEVRKWLDTLTHNEKYPFSTSKLRTELRHSLWLLNRVASAKALEKLLKEHPVFENYEIILAAGDGRSSEDDTSVNEKSFDRVKKAIREYEKTITLSVGQLTVGVTIPEWTAVMMLSNIKSPSLYMQAAFRAQNQWVVDIDGERHQKENAYVFDFAPERTLIIYDEFANNLQSKTADGGGTSEDREDNIKKLLNFFPVIAEDDYGKMVELDVRQVLTIPKTIKAQEVVKRGFMSNLLFQNIHGIFGSSEVREILEQLNPVAPGKLTPSQTATSIDTQNIKVDNDGNVLVDSTIVVSTTEARFGDKVYGPIRETLAKAVADSTRDLTGTAVNSFRDGVLSEIKELAKENNVSVAQAEQIVREKANILAREVEMLKSNTEIKKAEANVEYENALAEAKNNAEAVAEAKLRFNKMIEEIDTDFKEEFVSTVDEKTKELSQKSTEEIFLCAKEKTKTSVEDDIRARLRGFARTIPSFLMAYGTPAIRLANFDTYLTNEVFKEVTGISLEQFRVLRDTHNFFDAIVFDESVQEFLRKKADLANYFDDSQSEDIFDYIPPQRTNQIFTPKKVVKLMIDKLEEEDPDLFKSKDKTFADLYVKSGLYLTEIVKRLYAGLEKIIPKKEERLKYILEKQIYGFAPSEIIYAIARNFIFGTFANIDDSNLICRDLTEIAKSGGDLKMKFDVVVGNPPYQEETKDTSDTPIYPFFYDLAEQVASKYCLISPARFLFNAGKTKKTWNKKMLEDEHLKVTFYEQNSDKVFPNTDIKGGVAVLYRDMYQAFEAIRVFTTSDLLKDILKKVLNNNFITINQLIYAPESYRISKKMHEEHPGLKEKLSTGHLFDLTTNIFMRLSDFFYDENPQDGKDYIQIYGREKNTRQYKWIMREYVDEHANLDLWKVFVPKSNGSGALGEVLSTPVIGQPVIGQPVIGHTQTFISIGAFKTEFEAKALLKYIKSKFARTMLGTLKVTQDNKKETWANVPLQDFTSESDIDWTQSIPEIDRQLYKKYGLDKKEIAFIEEKVRAMD